MKKGKKGIYVFNRRLLFILCLFLVAFVILIFRLSYIQIIKGNKLFQVSQKMSTNIIKAKRGSIRTEDGEILAYDKETYEVKLDSTNIIDSPKKGEKAEGNGKTKERAKITPEGEEIIEILKKYFSSFNEISVREKIEKGNRGILIGTVDYKTKVTLEEAEKKILKVEKNGKKKKVLYFDQKFDREYIKNDSFQEIVGFLGYFYDEENKVEKNVGKYGLESYYNEKLTGINGYWKNYIRDLPSLDIIKSKKRIEAKDGNNLVLTINGILQYALDEEMNRVYNEYKAESSMGILIEVETGKILAMSSYPKATNRVEVKNRVIYDVFEPGSIFKPITIAIGLETGSISENSTVESSGSIKVNDRDISDHDNSTLGTLTLEKLIANSGNVGMVRIAQKIPNDKFYSYLSDVGFGKKTGIDINFEVSKALFPLKDMTPVKMSNISFGQGIDATQLQMLMALNTVINNGQMVKPYIVDRIEDSNGKLIEQKSPTVVRKVFSDEVSRINRNLMEAVVTKGTGKAAQIPGYRIGGKTGTAQKSGARGYENGKYFSSFFAFFPVDKPKYAILITVNEPKGSYYGAAVALPSAKTVLEKLIKYKGIKPNEIIGEKETEEQVVQSATMKKDLTRYKTEFNNGYMPDLTGLSMREIVAIFPQKKYPKYKLNGSGRVIGQFPKYGSRISSTTEIIINFE